MYNTLFKTGFAVVLLTAVAYQLLLKDLAKLLAGIGRDVQPLSDFPYRCRRITDPRLHACEDMWLSESTRQLFLACSESLARRDWQPNIHRFNVSGRSLTDAIIAMDIDQPKGDSFEYRVLTTPSFSGVNGDGRLHLVGMTGIDGSNEINLFIVNAKPSIDSVTGEFLDQETYGANSTIEQFTVGPAANSMKHVKTFADARIATPNNVAAVNNNEFFITNDHGLDKVGLKSKLGPVTGNGDVTYCDKTGCHRMASGLRFPNGLIRGQDGLIYVPSAAFGGIHVYQVLPDTHLLQKIDFIDIDYCMDNLSQDSNGDIYAAAFPEGMKMLEGFEDPFNIFPASTVLRIRKTEVGYQFEKVIEDRDAEMLPASTVAVHDAKTGRLFMGGVYSPFITVCDKI